MGKHVKFLHYTDHYFKLRLLSQVIYETDQQYFRYSEIVITNNMCT